MNHKPVLRLGLIGTGFMGRAHAFGFTLAPRVFDLPVEVRLEAVADIDGEAAERGRRQLGFARAVTDWRELIEAVDVVDITAPNSLHEEMALTAIAAGKAVYCEKPLAPTAVQAGAMTRAAESAGVVTQVGFNYLKSPLMALAREMIRAGELGEIRSYRGIHAEDYMADAAEPWSWRLDPAGGGGAGADLGSHAVATARYLLGPITEVRGHAVTAIPERPGDGGPRAVHVDDHTSAWVRFASGAVGTLEASWMATGRKMQHDFEVYGSKGALAFTQERFNELRLYRADDPAGRRGFRTICAGPEHDPYGAFCPAPGHQLGFNDLKVVEVRDFCHALAGWPHPGPDFREGWAVQTVVEAIYTSSRDDRWHGVREPADGA